jgi:predicted amidohydrolase YtcJ
MWVNSVALRMAGIDRSTPDPPNGAIQRDPRTGEPTGILLERANALVYRIVPPRTRADYVLELQAAIDALHASGFTAAQDPRTEYDEIPAWVELRDAGRLTLRSRLALMMEPDQTLAEWRTVLDEHERRLRAFRDERWLDGGILKCFIDGVVETGTAAMLEPYGHADEHGTGKAAFEADQLCAFVAEADRRGWQVQMHAIGDRAVRMALDAVEHAAAVNGDWDARLVRAPERRHRIEHLEVTAATDVARFADLGVVASVQPLHASCDPNRIAAWLDLLGAERTARAWPIAQLAAAGATIALGSDWPVVDFDPFATIAAAIERSNAVGAGWSDRVGSNALTLEQALQAYTYGSAVAAYAERRRGSIRVGKDADLAVLDRDLLAEGPSAVAGTRVLATVVGGRIVHATDGVDVSSR